MSIEQNSYKNLGGILLTIGWVLCLLLLSLLYHKSIYSAKTATIIANQSEIKIIIERSQDAHYHLQGKINNKDIEFLLDTGATKVCISNYLAKKINLKFGPIVTIETANGNVEGYLTKIPMLMIGTIKFNNVSAIIMPNMSNKALLGMNILKHFNISQQDNTLVLLYTKASSLSGS